MARGKAVAIVLSDRERVELERRVRRRKSCADRAVGGGRAAIAEKLGVSRTVGLWRGFAEKPMSRGPARRRMIAARALETTPDDATHWSRRMARATGISATTVHRIWGAFGLQPHRVELQAVERS